MHNIPHSEESKKKCRLATRESKTLVEEEKQLSKMELHYIDAGHAKNLSSTKIFIKIKGQHLE